ncbi:hypothetical protein [Microbacterium sp. PI-1]|uniref:hypothetical protein n=1 Tax=Microbacterium sp. PI-1 TaxID=2545631 RepID=UPI0023EA709F|nr:hypothetical protein [Microbacterium sp. PI-1]
MTNRRTISCQAAPTNAVSAHAATSTVRSRAYIFSRPILSVSAPKTVAPKKMPISPEAPISPSSTGFAGISARNPAMATPMRLMM